MATETFRSINYSDPSKFIEQNGRVELRRYTEDLLLYSDFDSTLNAEYSLGDIVPSTSGTVAPENNGVFAQHAHIENGYISYNENNFENLSDTGSIKFRLKTDFNNVPGTQSFSRSANPEVTSIPHVTTKTSKYGGASLDLTGGGEKRVEYDVSNISTMVQTGTIDFFFKAAYTGSPASDVMFFDYYNGSTNSNRIKIYHATDGLMHFRIWNQTGTLSIDVSFAWASNLNWNNLAFSFDGNNGNTKAFINGTQYGPTATNTFSRSAINTGYFLVGASTGYTANYYIDDFAIFDTNIFSANYYVRNISYKFDKDNLLVLGRFDTITDLDVALASGATAFYPVSGDYEFKLSINGSYYSGGDIVVTLNTEDEMLDVFNKVASALSGAPVSVTQSTEGNIVITGNSGGDVISIEEPNDGMSLVQILGGVEPSVVPNGPTANTDIVDLYNGADNRNRIIITHTNTSNLTLKMYDNSGNLIVDEDFGVWSNNNVTWYAFELDWNDTIGQFYIDGDMLGLFKTSFNRMAQGRLYLRAGADSYRFDELQVYNTYQNKRNYTVEENPLYEYSSENPFIDIDFGTGFKEDEVKDININASPDVYYVVGIDNNWYYYIAGAWRASNGTYSQSSSPSVMEINFSDIYFNENQTVKIRAFFHSDGQTLIWIDEIRIVTETLSESSARITSTIDLRSGVDLSSDQHVVITTNQGNLEVDLTTQVAEQPAEHIGTEDMSIGYDWATNGTETFFINGTEIVLNQSIITLNDLIELISSQLPGGVEAFTSESKYVGLKTTAIGPTVTLDLAEGTDGLVRLGMIDDTYTGALPDLTNITLEDILNAIDAANVPGLAPASTDGSGHIVLQSTTTGNDAYISISEGITSNALDVVWGYEATDSGEEAEGTFFDYSNIYNWIRSMLGAPVIPVELTDEQLENCVGRAVYWYNYYREAKENLIYAKLSGNEVEGYTIPQEVGGEQNIIEIVVRPRFPFAYYTGGSANNIMSNLYVQWMFQRGRNTGQFKDFIGDYYITLSTEQDYSIILGTQIKWNFYNGKIFINPRPEGMDVGIIFRSAVSMDEINTNSLIRSYALGEAKQILGTIRATFGGTIPGGTENIQLRGESMIAEGKEEVQAALDKLMKLSEPLFLSWG